MQARAEQPGRGWSGRALTAAGTALAGAAWLSAAIFGAYILAFYGGAASDRAFETWNTVLPRLYEPGTPAALAGIGMHMAAGAVLLLFGPIQLIAQVRDRVPWLHRGMGRIYVAAAFLAGAGGLAFIFLKGTVGGAVMSAGFGLYGALVVLASVQTFRHAVARRLEPHRAWAIRLFALVIGSWLYRMDYGFWTMITGDIGHTQDFHGPFDAVMAFLFYIPNLAVAELFIRARRAPEGAAFRAFATAVVTLAAAIVLLGTYYFTVYEWSGPILQRLGIA